MAINSQKFLPGAKSGSIVATTYNRSARSLMVAPPPSATSGAAIPQAQPDGGDPPEDPLLKEAIRIRESTTKIKKILGQTVKIQRKKIELDRRRTEKEKRNKKEKENEKNGFFDFLTGGPNKIKAPKPIQGFLDFVNQIILGLILRKLVDWAPQLKWLANTLQVGKVFDFIVDFSIGMVDKLMTFIDLGYKAVDSVNNFVKDTFGEDAAKNLETLQSNFTKFMNLAIIAAMLSTGGKGPKGKPQPRRGFDRSGRRVSARAQERYRRRYGDRRFNQRFGQNNRRMLEGKPLSRAEQRARRSRPTAKPQTGPKGLQKVTKKIGTKLFGKGVGKIAGKIPIVGPLIDFGVRAFILKEPLGKAAAGAVGAGVGQALGTFLGGAIGGIVGSVVPFVGNLLVGGAGSTIGGIIGGVIGDQIGVSLYNVITGGEDAGAVEEAGLEAKAKGGTIGEDEERDKKELERLRRTKLSKFSVSSSGTTPADGAVESKGAEPNVFQKIFGRIKKEGPLALINKVRKRLGDRNNTMISKIMSLGVDLLTGKKVDRRAVTDIAKNLVTFFDAALPAPMGMLRLLLQKLAAGGSIVGVEAPAERTRRLKDITRQLETAFVRDVGSQTSGVFNDIKSTAANTNRVIQGTASATGTTGTTTTIVTGGSTPTVAGRTISGSDKLVGLTGQSGTVAYGGQQGTRLDISYSPFAQSDIQDQASRGGIKITSGKGYRESTNSDHKGYDIGADSGTPMYAYLDGEVTHVNKQLGGGADAGYGYWIVWKDSKHGAYHFFGHLDRPPGLSPGDKFKAGALLANVGGSGFGSLTRYAPHLHWEISTSAPAANGQFSSYVDPGKWVNTHGAGELKPQIASNPPSSGADQIADRASYEQTQTQVVAIEKEVPVYRTVTKQVQTRRGTRTRTVRELVQPA